MVDIEDVPDLNQDEFNQLLRDGRKLVLFNNFIIDVETFMSEHPGTRFVIAENIGNDIGKFFYGAYSMEDDVKPHVHSNYAASVLKKLTVGRLKVGFAKIEEDFDRRESSKLTSYSNIQILTYFNQDSTENLHSNFSIYRSRR